MKPEEDIDSLYTRPQRNITQTHFNLPHSMKRLITTYIFLLLVGSFTHLCAQPATQLRPFEGHFYCKDTGVHIHLNLYESNLEAPGFSFLGKMNGYMSGGIYGTWMLINHEVKGKKAMLRFSNDIGSDSQDIEFIQTTDTTYTYRAINGNVIKRAVGRKLEKVTANMEFRRK